MKMNKPISIFLFVIIIISCDTVERRWKKINEMKNHFISNKSTYYLLVDYFKKPNSYMGFSYPYKKNHILLKAGINSKSISNIEIISYNDTLYRILKFMKKYNIRDISGNEEWIHISTNEFIDFSPCFSFWYRKNIDISKNSIIIKTKNISNTKTTDWIYFLDKNWYIKGEHCF